MTDAMQNLHEKGRVVTVLTASLNDATFAQRAENAWGTPKSTYASGLGAECMRMLWYSRMGYKEHGQQRPEWLRNASTGSSMHENYQALMLRFAKQTGGLVRVATTAEVLEAAGLSLSDFPYWVQKKGLPTEAIELPIPANSLTEIGGRGDVITRLTGTFEQEEGEPVVFDNELAVVEIKTMKQKDFTSLPKNPKWKKYYAQTEVYLHFYKIRYAIIFAINRNDDAVKEVLIERDDEFIKNRLRFAYTLKNHLKEQTVPPANRNPYGDCLFCGHRDRCDLQDME